MGHYDLPASRAEIREIQSVRKREVFERAKTASWYKGKLDHINPDKLDDPEEWQKIPILDKDTLRQWSHEEFMTQICVAPKDQIAEYWRSGGSTGKPVFYPRTFEDVTQGIISWGRNYECIGIYPGDLCHISFPIGIHPAGQIWARSAHHAGIGMNWVGAGNSVPSRIQLDLIQSLKPTVLVSMPGFAIHLANLAENEGIDLTKSSIRKIVCSAESLSASKREKLTRMWGAEIYDVFGMSEAGLMGAESEAHDGIHIWSDMYFVEVVDPDTGKQLPEGEAGTFCVTPLVTSNATPFLRWNSGDVVRYFEHGKSKNIHGELFPIIQHAHRTTGFFKLKGVNINHTDFEDFVFANPDITDFQGVMSTAQSGIEQFTVRIEIRRGSDAKAVTDSFKIDITNYTQIRIVRIKIRLVKSIYVF
ncbi:MAG: AMP-binding protein [Rhizobiales bacterium]|nr:AMP-binding protein [Hyphomicrobiales bacterium]